ncbi:hypothetical protein WA158_002291 [Blastocystis sp. Blastoise]
MSSSTETKVRSAFPPPPYYYKYFKKPSYTCDPPECIHGDFEIFQTTYKSDLQLLTLEQCGIEKKYDDSKFETDVGSVQTELSKLLKNTLFSYQSIIADTSEHPTSETEKISEIHANIANMLYLTNYLRPSESRQDIIRSLEKEIKVKEQLIENIDTVINKTSTMLNETQTMVQESNDNQTQTFQQIQELLTTLSPLVNNNQ